MSNGTELKALVRHAFDAQDIGESGWVSGTDTSVSIFLEKNPDNDLGVMSASRAIEVGSKKPVTVVFVESLTPAEQSRMRQSCVFF